ncbi:MAG: hypothetical protein Q9170_002806 [Blastenia crenularia]
MERLIMTLSDQQLLAGIAILIAGFLSHCSISVYHFSILSDLAWFSSNTHLTSLGVLQIYLAERPSLRTWRLCLMLTILLGLIVTTVLEGHRQLYELWGSPARCLFSSLPGNISGAPARLMATNLTLLLCGYGFAIYRLYSTQTPSALPRESTGLRLRNAYSSVQRYRFPRTPSEIKADIHLMIVWPVHMARVGAMDAYIAVATCLSSIVASLCFDLSWFIYGMRNIFVARYITASTLEGNENAWTFGQIMAVLLLSSIILTVRDIYSEQNATLSNHIANHPADAFYVAEQLSSQAEAIQNAHLDHQILSEELDPVISSPKRVDTEAGGRAGASGISLQARDTEHSLAERISH